MQVCAMLPRPLRSCALARPGALRPVMPPSSCLPAPLPAPRCCVLQWFEKVDKDGSGHITAVELQQALEEGGMFFSVGTAAHIIRCALWGRSVSWRA